ncbi:MAG TPA: sigma-70 family RNA polymerase sigma factor [Spirochaetales bacterium]|nr:sigma-70 family RNA polymerase sigma factor [Spirochaetales bacterium]MBP7263165.1 sigma-70 family RNA polymerase sigma factor [Spirochaetia bacterium]HPE36064.1 sigma-70 family RNA polymerase sigma factor [Spirochaetales bacterium]
MSGSLDEATDEEVISRVLEGDRDAFGILVGRYQRRLLRLGYGFFKDADAAEDFAQDVLVKAYVGLSGFRGKSRFSTWLTRIAYNAGINAKRRSGRYEPLESEPEDLKNLSPEDEHLRNETAAALKTAMAALPEKYAVCLDLYFKEGMKYQDISEATGFPVNTIKSHVFRAKRDLRRAIGLEDEA